MSQISFTHLPIASLASSVAGGQQARPAQNSNRASTDRQDFKATLEQMTDKTNHDVDDPTLESDRDADGRSLFDQLDDQQPNNSSDDDHPDHNSPDPPPATDSAIGRRLDLEA